MDRDMAALGVCIGMQNWMQLRDGAEAASAKSLPADTRKQLAELRNLSNSSKCKLDDKVCFLGRYPAWQQVLKAF